jgi:hypothetical protein
VREPKENFDLFMRDNAGRDKSIFVLGGTDLINNFDLVQNTENSTPTSPISCRKLVLEHDRI